MSDPRTKRTSQGAGNKPSKRKPRRRGTGPFTHKGYLRHYTLHDYHDHSDLIPEDVEEETRMRPPRGGVQTTFPMLLHKALEEASLHGYDDIISWLPHGRAFRIHDTKRFAEEVLPNYFQHQKKQSFLRQLSLYGFKRLTRDGEDRGGYYHECFLRQRPFLCPRIQRKRIKGTWVRKASSPETEPDFHTMPHVRDLEVVERARAQALNEEAPTTPSDDSFHEEARTKSEDETEAVRTITIDVPRTQSVHPQISVIQTVNPQAQTVQPINTNTDTNTNSYYPNTDPQPQPANGQSEIDERFDSLIDILRNCSRPRSTVNQHHRRYVGKVYRPLSQSNGKLFRMAASAQSAQPNQQRVQPSSQHDSGNFHHEDLEVANANANANANNRGRVSQNAHPTTQRRPTSYQTIILNGKHRGMFANQAPSPTSALALPYSTPTGDLVDTTLEELGDTQSCFSDIDFGDELFNLDDDHLSLGDATQFAII